MKVHDEAVLEAAATIVAAQITSKAFDNVTDHAVLVSALDAAMAAVKEATARFKPPAGTSFLTVNSKS